MNTKHPSRRAVLSAAAVSVGMIGSAVHAKPNVSTNQSNKDIVRNALEAWSRGTNAPFIALISEDIRWTIVGHSLIAGTTNGKAELNEKTNLPFVARFNRSSTKFRPVRIHGIYEDGDMVIIHFDGHGIANDGKPYANSYAWFLTMRGGRVIAGTAFFDSIAFNDLWTRVRP